VQVTWALADHMSCPVLVLVLLLLLLQFLRLMPSTTRSLLAGFTLFEEGDKIDFCYVILQVCVYKCTAQSSLHC
jgi:hypothetical protein